MQINHQIFLQIQETLFLAHFLNFWGKKSIFQKLRLYHAGWKDSQTLFHKILPAAAGVLTSKTAVELHLKVKDIEYDVSLTKN